MAATTSATTMMTVVMGCFDRLGGPGTIGTRDEGRQRALRSRPSSRRTPAPRQWGPLDRVRRHRINSLARGDPIDLALGLLVHDSPAVGCALDRTRPANDVEVGTGSPPYLAGRWIRV